MKALEGLKVLDFTTLLPGPYATLLLADLGAEVLKVSGRDKYDLVVHWPPEIEGSGTTAAAAWLGRNKKTIFLNLKKPSAVEAVKRLILEYDILVEQFRYISGREDVVDQACAGLEVLSVQQMGRHKTAAVRGSDAQFRQARQADVDVSPMNLQNVFVALCGHGDAQ